MRGGTIFRPKEGFMWYGLVPLWGREGVRGFAVVDGEDYADVMEHRWFWSRGYAVRSWRRHPHQFTEQMHRRVLRCLPGEQRVTDHINRDKLDNRKRNLRLVTQAVNNQNMPAHKTGSSRYRGVNWDKRRGRWVATYATKFLGYFDDELQAAEAAAAYRRDHVPGSIEAFYVAS